MTDIMENLNTHPFDLTGTTKVQKKHNITPPTPQLSQDDLVSGLEVSSKLPITPSDSTGLFSPASPKQQDLLLPDDEEIHVVNEEEYHLEHDASDVATMIYQEFVSLIYWNIPGRSGIVLGGILSLLLLTSYYSLLYVVAASLTIATGFNLVFVNFYNFIRTVWTGLPIETFAHPFHPHLDNYHISAVSRELTEFYLHKTIDVLEVVVQATARTIYVEDTKTTGVICLLSGLIYVATSYIPTKVFFGLFILAVFTMPYYYTKHQDVVDEQLNLIMKKSKVAVDKYSNLVRRNSTTIYNNSIAIVQQRIKNQRRKSSSSTSIVDANQVKEELSSQKE